MTPVDRNLLTAQLDEALEHDGCAICFRMGVAERRHLDMLLYEQINDLGTRRVLRRSRGYCQFHTYQLLDVGGYGIHAKIAILYRDLVDDMSAQVEALDGRKPSALRVGEACPCCASVRQCEGTFTSLMASTLSDPERRAAYARSCGLCLTHWEAVYNQVDRERREFLRLDLARRLRMLSADMSEFVRKSVVRTEPFGHERDVWIRVLRAYAGSLREPRTHPETDDSRAKEATP